MSKPAIEVVVFKLKEGVSDEAFLQAAAALNPELKRMPGFLKRELGKDAGGTWVDILHWSSLEAAMQALEGMADAPGMAPFMELIDAAQDSMLHVEPRLEV
ncbi:antibiotic biosynthesis monooxygenase family protein [Calidithermus chliarophilus]|uniref:antibiotic biosynthesis monooxygenase family protein n=1 Tax=Calidithermus chliarophilus TaxID=52023 RepID=UPI0003F904C2|nr:antibiotic biosynthesis monooxygenase [Calidithermus chliarophilus]